MKQKCFTSKAPLKPVGGGLVLCLLLLEEYGRGFGASLSLQELSLDDKAEFN